MSEKIKVLYDEDISESQGRRREGFLPLACVRETKRHNSECVCVCVRVQKGLNQGDDYSRVLGHPVGGVSLDRRKEKGGRGEGPQIESLTPPQYGGRRG